MVQVATLPALQGDEKWSESIKELLRNLDSYIPEPERLTDKPFLMAIEDVFVKGRGTVATGRIERGIVKTGEEVEIIDFTDTRKTITGVEMFRKILDEGQAEQRRCPLRGIDKNEVERGQVLAHPGSITPHTKFEGEVYVLKKEEGGRHTPFFTNYRPQFYIRTTDVTGAPTARGRQDGDAWRQHQDERRAHRAGRARADALQPREGSHTVGAGVVTKVIE